MKEAELLKEFLDAQKKRLSKKDVKEELEKVKKEEGKRVST